MRILILKRHKEAVFRELAMFLENKNLIDFSIVGTLEAAKSELKTFKNNLHVIIVGQYLENGNGLEFIHYANKHIADIPILLVTAMPLVDQSILRYKNVKVYKSSEKYVHPVYYDFLEKQYTKIMQRNESI